MDRLLASGCSAVHCEVAICGAAVFCAVGCVVVIFGAVGCGIAVCGAFGCRVAICDAVNFSSINVKLNAADKL